VVTEKTLLLGLDISTTGAKALLVDETGAVVSAFSTPLTLSTPHPLWSEQDPAEWWTSMVQSIRQTIEKTGVSGDAIDAIGLTGQMHGLVLLDDSGGVLRPAILWNDQRTASQCDDIRKRMGKDRLIQITGNDALTGFTAPKILWVRENEPDVYNRVRHILLPKDYIRYRLTEEYATDRAGGAGTLLFDIAQRSWSDEVLNSLDISPDWLPPTHEGPQITGRITTTTAAKTGLAVGTPVVAGGSDQAAQAVGSGVTRPGIVGLTLGTSGVVFASTDRAVIEPEGRLHAFCHAIPGRWHLMGVMLSAAGSLQWYRDTLAPGTEFEDLIETARDIPLGSDGLLFLPYLTGERTPHPDPLARGAFIGLTSRHTQAHMTRSVLEGVAFGLRDGFELLRSAGLGEFSQVRVSGGGAKSSLWRQILADVFNMELVTVNTTEGAAYGAALLAGVGAGVWSSVDRAVEATVTVTGSTRPRGTNVAEYQRIYDVYRQLYPALKQTFSQLV